MTEQQSVISIKEFVQCLAAGGGIVPSPADCVAYGYKAGWLEAQDIVEQERQLKRKSAARIIHEFLRRERKESDEIDSSPAYRLKDLFDCRICAGHIIQVYLKGIMDEQENGDGSFVFGTEEPVSKEEAVDIVKRLFCLEKRTPRKETQKQVDIMPDTVSVEQAVQLCKEKSAVLADVRNLRAFEDGHLEGAIHIPLLEIIKNPYAMSENRDKIILLYCEEGYQSETAARCLLEAGYEKVAYIKSILTVKDKVEGERL